ncbi:MAG: beta-lactamase family protein [Flavobacteriales bacterium]|nr:beta-lactamase family protein [Flavobacteriales bacterium]
MKSISIILLIFATSLCSYSQSIEIKIDSIIKTNIKEFSIVGISIGIVHKGHSFTKNYGTTNTSKKIKVSDSTMFHIASISKLYTTISILQLVEQRKLKLTDYLKDILPSFKMKDERHKQITIEHLLTHSSGLTWDNKLKKSPDNHSSIELYLNNLNNQKLNFKPGEKSSFKTYSNIGFDLLGIVIESISGIHFDKYVRENILEPLEMHKSTYFYEDIDSIELAIPQIISGNSKKIKRLNFYGIDDNKNPILNGEPLDITSYQVYGEDYEHNPSGNLISSSKELNLWTTHLLDIYKIDNFKGILSRKSLIDMWNSHRKINNQSSFGWCWWIDNEDEYGKSVYHGGSYTGFSSLVIIYPEQDFGITILCNGWYAQNAIWKNISKEIIKLYLNK